MRNYFRIRSIFLIFLISTLASFVAPFVPTTSAKINSEMTTVELAQSYTYLTALSACFDGTIGPNGQFNDLISSDSALAGKWFGNRLNDDTRVVGYIDGDAESDKNEMNCNNIVSKAYVLWGFNSPLELLCSFYSLNGGNRRDGSGCLDNSGGSFNQMTKDYVNDLQTAIYNRIYGGNKPDADPVSYNSLKYELYQAAFFANKGCSATPGLGTGEEKFNYRNIMTAEPTDVYTYTDKAGNTVSNNLQIANDPTLVKSTSTVFKAVPHDYHGNDNGSKRSVFIDLNGNTVKNSCKEISEQMSALAPYVVRYYSIHPDLLSAGVSEGLCNGANSSTNPDCIIKDGTTSCAIDGIGWIICPVVNFLAKISDQSYEFLKNNFLETKTSLFDSGSGTYEAWSIMRSIANIVFVIAFLIIIFSQLTSAGISSYGVKKMLPRLVIAAILVNVSYFICQIAVDISNILGYSLNSTLSGIVTANGNAGGAFSTGGGFAGLAGGLLAGAATIALAYAMLSSLIATLVAAVIALIMILFLLVARQALIVLLVVISPLAFVAFLLPNTEEYFKKWRKMFMALLMLFPVIAVVYGMSTLASNILANAFTLSGDTDNWFGSIIAAAVAILPLFIVPGLLKKSLDSAGSIGGKINGLGGKLGGALGRKGSQGYDNSRLSQFKKYRKDESALKRAQIQSGTYSGKGGRANPANLASGINKAINNSRLSGKFGDRASTKGAVLSDTEDAELLKNATSKLENSTINGVGGPPLSQAQMMQIATGKDLTDSSGAVLQKASSFDTHARRAAIQKATKIATVREAEDLSDSASTMSALERKTLTSSLAGSSAVAKAPYLGGKNLGYIEQGFTPPGGETLSNYSALEAISDGKITAETLAGGDVNSTEKLLKVAQASPFGSPERAALRAAYAEFNKPDSRLRERVVAGGKHDMNIQAMRSL